LSRSTSLILNDEEFKTKSLCGNYIMTFSRFSRSVLTMPKIFTAQHSYTYFKASEKSERRWKGAR